MKNVFLLNTCIFLANICYGQFSDNFDDGDFAGWSGDVDSFIVDAAFQLQLQGDCVAGGDNYLSVPVSTHDSAVWEFFVDLDFDPSTFNHTKIYLQSDNPNLLGEINGYYIRIGKDGTSDVAELYRQTGLTTNLILSGTINLSVAPKVGIKVVRTDAAEWQLNVDASGGTSYIYEGSIIDATYNGGSYIGVYCKYSLTRCDLFRFDNFFVDPLYTDVDAPSILSATVLSSSQLEIDFSENVELISAEDEGNYIVDGGVGNPINATRDAFDLSKVVLTFAEDFPEAITLTITANNIEDEVGNILISDAATFSYYTINQYDILINEIFADIEPAIELPKAEYVELYNAAPVDINLEGFVLLDATSESEPFPSYILPSGGYVIIFDITVLDSFLAFTNVLPVGTFPSLNNDADDLQIVNAEGLIIHKAFYTIDWYDNAIKENGGWSLEMIDPSNPCQEDDNWTASENISGGTPGVINSVFGPNMDEIAPALISAYPSTTDTIIAFFDEAIAPENVIPSDFNISGGIGSPLSLIIDPNTPEIIGMVLSTPLSVGIGYTLTVENLTDCSGNIIGLFNTVLLGLPEPVDSLDIVINEVLFNPYTDGFDFVELYNNSDKIIDLSKIIIAELDILDTTEVTEFGYVSTSGRLFFPGTYICATLDINNVLSTYMAIDTGNFVEMTDLPGFPDNEGIVVLYDATLNVLDELHYYDDWHYDLLVDDNGVSLERVNYEFITQDENNWHSAAANVHYATPGYQNSVFGLITGAGEVSLEYNVFSPDGDGYHDLLLISYLTSSEGFSGIFKIFDAQGKLIKELTNIEILGREGFLTWDGIDDDGNAGRSGIYILYAELFSAEGIVEKYKMKFTLIRKQ